MSTRKPFTVIFFPNGNAACGDQHGQQYSRYQFGGHGDTVKALELDGYKWSELPDVLGRPDGRRQLTDAEIVEKLASERYAK